jgi:predicted AAA+ superfamily ATPase
MFQNFVYKMLYEKYFATNLNVKFWRTTDKAEVDFILENGESITPIEVKYSFLKKPEISKSMKSFCEKYFPKEMIVVNLSLKEEVFI